MFNLIERYINNLTIDQVNNFALSKGANLNNKELKFTYNFIKNNYKKYLMNPNSLNLDEYKNYYTPNNFKIIKEVFNEYFQKFKNYL